MADFSQNDLSLPEDSGWEELSEQIGCVLAFDSGPDGGHRREIPEALAGKPRVTLSSFRQKSEKNTELTIPTALPGVETDGVFLRADGLPLSARRIPDLTVSDYPTFEQVLSRLIEETT